MGIGTTGKWVNFAHATNAANHYATPPTNQTDT